MRNQENNIKDVDCCDAYQLHGARWGCQKGENKIKYVLGYITLPCSKRQREKHLAIASFAISASQPQVFLAGYTSASENSDTETAWFLSCAGLFVYILPRSNSSFCCCRLFQKISRSSVDRINKARFILVCRPYHMTRNPVEGKKQESHHTRLKI